MIQSKDVKIAFWRGLVFGPLAVFPATIIAAIFSITFQRDSLSFGEAMQTSLMISIWGICIAYVLVASFGAVVWYALWRVHRLSLGWLLGCSLIPSALIAVSTSDKGFTFMAAYYSLAVCFTCWFVGLRNVHKL